MLISCFVGGCNLWDFGLQSPAADWAGQSTDLDNLSKIWIIPASQYGEIGVKYENDSFSG